MNEFADVLNTVGKTVAVGASVLVGGNVASGGRLFENIGIVKDKLDVAAATPLLEANPPNLSSIPQIITDNTGTTNIVDLAEAASNFNIPSPEQFEAFHFLMNSADMIGDALGIGQIGGYTVMVAGAVGLVGFMCRRRR
ncbi:hypothetical protein A2767_06050 [Candidatus Roizmanbacteria bacterium RIFCSPHIGHO2_01_FULL_35_10]|uniref:Uncharacterized protein n=1 Tax=Candidatus Roizmanbacteria bacterium RIFCSPLOWO2_01_FULL_35_13 TaxID=1802055 RepID=A0A1F7IHY1_9BACT|nr:MAG: hypothetical protein A2767_06050 [Candidatus Roizmanbacteria bacterium RIFCSPHIGHO2_01_FULL_35_10]OGK42967.1 MAG: hypothetical protein A3A74_05870 [Candidatus Roizmanbacteria bacterium RIFCSPLOWO2_01_FULL_35_13]